MAPAQKPPAADAAFVFERLHMRVRFENDGSGRREQTLWVKVLDEQAVRQFGEFPLVYQPDSEDLAVTEVAVEKPDGSVVPTPLSGIQDVSAIPAGGLPVYVDLRQKIVSVAALRPNDVLRITAVWTINKPIAPGQFWFEHSFDDSDSVQDELLEIDLPADRAVALKVRAGAPAEERGGGGAVAAGRRIYRWKTSHPAADAKPPVVQPGDDAPTPDVRLSSFRNWDEFAKWFTPLAYAQPDAGVKAKAESLTSAAPDAAGKIAAIYRFASAEIRYVSLSFGLGRFAAHVPADVLKAQYGDCKDKAVLLRAMLDVVGVRVVPVLINTMRSIDEDFASPLEFDHMVAVIPRGQALDGTWMDATIEVAPLGVLGPQTRDRRALALPGDGKAALLRTPAEPAVPTTSEISVEGAVNGIGVLEAKVTLIERGDAELFMRSMVRAVPRSRLAEVLQGIGSAVGIEGEVTEVTTSDPADTVQPFRVTYRIRTRGVLDWAAAHSDMRVALHDIFPYAKAEDRKDLHRLHFATTRVDRLHASIDLPAGYVATAPVPVSVTRAGLTYTSTYRTDGTRLIVDRETKVAVRDVPESAFGEYTAFVTAADADVAQPFRIRNEAAAAPAVPPDATADELYAAGNSAWHAARYESAAVMFKRATELAPKKGDAWIGLGLAYNKLDKLDDAADAIQKQIDLDPYNKRAYGDLGFVLKNAGKTDQAIKAYARHVELNALDGDAFEQLGLLYGKTGRNAEAIASLEKASTLLPRDAWVPAELVRPYVRAGQPDNARQAVDRALERQADAEVREYLAWQMADNGLDLSRAEELARGAEKEFLDEYRDVELKSLTQRQLDHVERLAWTWDALGWIDFQRGRLTEADAYSRAAWQLLGDSDVAYHLAQICEKRDKLADALSYYLTAESLEKQPSAELQAHVKKLAGGGDLSKMLNSAREMAPIERSFAMQATFNGDASFLAVVDNSRKTVDARFVSGDDRLKPMADNLLRSVALPVLFPPDTPVRLPLGLRVHCSGTECRGIVEYPTRVKVGADEQEN